jgi:hypothetical protein
MNFSSGKEMEMARTSRLSITFRLAIMIAALTVSMLAGCNKGSSSSTVETSTVEARPDSSEPYAGKPAPAVSTETSPAAQSNSNSQGNAPSTGAAASSELPDPVKMIGTYEMTQVQKEGVVSMISERKVEIRFSPDGTYSRFSKVKDKSVHDDHGQYRIENGDQLVLTIQVSKKVIHNPPIEKRHKISLSLDGDELKMISENGDLALFRKVR